MIWTRVIKGKNINRAVPVSNASMQKPNTIVLMYFIALLYMTKV